MSVNYTLLDIEQSLMEHPFGLTMDELYEFQQYYTDFWESNVYSEDLQPLDEFVEEFLLWLETKFKPLTEGKNYVSFTINP